MTYSKPYGVSGERLTEAKRVIDQTQAELNFVPGSQPRLSLSVNELTLLVQAARDGLAAHQLYEAVMPAQQELTDIGRTEAAPHLGAAIQAFVQLHPDLKED